MFRRHRLWRRCQLKRHLPTDSEADMTAACNWQKLIGAAAIFALAAARHVPTAHAAEPFAYAVDFVSTMADGRAMNDKGVAAGIRYVLPPGCTPFTCLGM